jgi:hypothetical protein
LRPAQFPGTPEPVATDDLIGINSKVREYGEHRATRRALEPPDGEPTQADAHIMRVTGQAPTAAAGGLVFQLKAQGQHEGEDAFDKRFAIAKQLIIGRFVLKVDGNGPVFAGLAGAVAHGSSSGQMVGVTDDPTWGNTCPSARGREGCQSVTTKLSGM